MPEGPRSTHDGRTGRPPVRDWMGGGENLRSKDVAVLHQGPETFLPAMMMDGVFERFPKLRGASVELGAGWVPAMLGALIDASFDDIYLVSSDYPHVEGGKDPIGQFESSLGVREPHVRGNFYAENFLKLFPNARAH